MEIEQFQDKDSDYDSLLEEVDKAADTPTNHITLGTKKQLDALDAQMLSEIASLKTFLESKS